MPVKDACLPSLGVYRLARIVAQRYGFSWMEYGRVQKQYRERYGLPLVIENDCGMLWIDRYYIAYQLEDGEVHYVYLTKHHIHEEMLSYKEASKERGVKVDLPGDIKQQFSLVLRQMAKNTSDIWLSPEFDSEKKLSKRGAVD